MPLTPGSRAFSMAAVLLGATEAVAQTPAGDPSQAPPQAPVQAPSQAPPPIAPTLSDLERRLTELEKKNAALREELDQLREEHTFVEQQVQTLLPLSGRIGGYVDFGFFFVQGNGAGIRNDIGNEVFPEYAGVVSDAWVFMGDPLSTAINSRGDPADTGDSRAITFDPVDSRGESSFILSALNLHVFAGIGEDLTLDGSVDLVPRGRDVSNPDGLFLGDYIDLKLAYAQYVVPIEALELTLYAGKFDSVLGYEYRSQDAPDRLGITPSLICRYTCGRPLGLKARGSFLDEAVTLAVSATNGSHFVEGFPFADETDRNQWKTLAGRLSVRAPLGAGLEAGVSGAFGAQDGQNDEAVYQWHYGVDAHLDWHNVLLTAEIAVGQAEGKTEPGAAPCGGAACLDYKGAYGQAGYRLFNWLTPYARVDWREALHQSGASFVYVSDLIRVTGGVRLELGTSVIIKAEYTVNRELGRIPELPNDVMTSSLVVKY
jgi:hypothetical protein